MRTNRWLDGWYPLPTRVQILVLALSLVYFRISGDARLVGGDGSVDYEAYVATSSI